MVLTFEPNPLAILRPEIAPAVLTEPGFKAQLVEALGADALLVVPFTKAFSRIRADRFAEMLGSAPLSAESIVVGANFRFGHGGSGTVPYLQRLGRARGLTVESPPTVMSPDGKPVSSTRVRRLVAQGEVAEALTAGADRIMLDNFDAGLTRAAVELIAGRAEIEVSGGLTLDNLDMGRLQGVDFISSGSLTKDVRALDLSMRVELIR
jgi:hypothetical protein